MSRSTTRSARTLAPLTLVLSAAAVLALSACSSGQVTQTAAKQASVPGVSVTQGDVAIRNAVIVFPPSGVWKAGTAPEISVRLVNIGRSDDRLIGATAEVAEFVQLLEVPGASASASASPSPATSASPSASPSPATSPSPSGSPGVAPGDPSASASPGLDSQEVKIDLPVPVGELVTIDPAGRRLILQNIQRDIRAGELVEVTLRFERAGEVTLSLPVSPPLEAQPRATPVKDAEHPIKPGAEGH